MNLGDVAWVLIGLVIVAALFALAAASDRKHRLRIRQQGRDAFFEDRPPGCKPDPNLD